MRVSISHGVRGSEIDAALTSRYHGLADTAARRTDTLTILAYLTVQTESEVLKDPTVWELIQGPYRTDARLGSTILRTARAFDSVARVASEWEGCAYWDVGLSSSPSWR
jgi:hypothetical protein